MNIVNPENNHILQYRSENFMEIAYLHFGIAIGLKKFPDLETVEKQETVITLNSQEIESILIEYEIKLSETRIGNMDGQSLKNFLQPSLNGLKGFSQGKE